MFIRLFLTFLLLTQLVFEGKAQTILVVDSCTNNTSTFKRINDSLYYVESHYNGKLVFSGGVIRPDTASIYNARSEYLWTYKHHGLSVFNDNIGRLSEKIRFENGEEKEHWLYCDQILCSYDGITDKGSINRTYTNGKLASEVRFNGKTYINTTKYYVNGKKLVTREKLIEEHPGSGYTYKPLNRVTKYYDPDNFYLVQKIVKHRGGKKFFYLYEQGQLSNIKVVDKYGETLYLLVYSNGVLTNKTTHTLKNDKNGHLLYKKITIQGYFKGKLSKNMDTSFLFIKDNIKQTIFMKYAGYEEYYKWDKTGLQFKRIYLYGEEGSSESQYIVTDSSYNVTEFVNGEKKSATNVVYDSRIFDLDFSWSGEREGKISLFPLEDKFDNWYYSSYFLGFTQKIINAANNNRLYRSDTFFRNNKPFLLERTIDESFSKYRLNTSGWELIYDNSYRIAKDINQCGEGLKNKNNEWVIPAEYDQISTYGQDTSFLYYATRNDYLTIYNWKGKRLAGPVFGAEIYYESRDDGFFELDSALCDSLGLKDKRAIIVNDTKAGRFYLLSLDDKIILELKNPFRLEYFYNENNVVPEFVMEDTLNRKGFADFKGVNIPCIYAEITHLKNGYFAVKKPQSDSLYFLNPFGKKMDIPYFSYIQETYKKDTVILFDFEQHPRLFSINRMEYCSPMPDYTVSNTGLANQFEITKNGKFGLLDLELKITLPIKYTRFDGPEDKLLGYYKDSIDFYDLHYYGEGVEYSNSLKCDTLYDIYNTENETFLFKRNEKYGLIDRKGKVLVDAGYDDICFLGEYYFLVNENEISKIISYQSDSVEEISAYFPTDRFIQMQSRLPDYKVLLFDAYGKYIDGQVYDSYGLDRTLLSSVNKDGEFLGNINSLGQWVFKNRDFDKITFLPSLNFYALAEEVSGVCNCKGRPIIPIEYQYISYDESENLLWFNSIQIPNGINPREVYHNIWQVKNLKTNKILNDTLNYPTQFKNGFCVISNNHKYYGVIDSALNVKIPFQFKEYRFNFNHNLCYFYQDNEVWVCNLRFDVLKKIKLNKLAVINYLPYYMGYKDGMAYLLDSNFNYLDSSTNFFVEKTYKIKSYQNSEEIPASGEQLTEDIFFKDWNPGINVENFKTSIYAYYNESNENEAYQYGALFVFPELDIYYDKYDYSEELSSNIKLLKESWVPKDSNSKYSPTKFTVNDLNESNRIAFQNNSHHTATFSHYNITTQTNQFSSYYLDSLNGVYKLPLHELIDYGKQNAFVSLVRKHLALLENPGIPCFAPDDYVQYFETRFVIGSSGFIFYLDGGFDFTIPPTEMRTLLNPYWKEKF